MLLDEYCTIMLHNNIPISIDNEESRQQLLENTTRPKQNISFCVDISSASTTTALPTFFLPSSPVPSLNNMNAIPTQLSNSSEMISSATGSNSTNNTASTDFNYENNPFAVEVSPQFFTLSDADNEIDMAFAGEFGAPEKDKQLDVLGVRYVDISSNSMTNTPYDSQKLVYLHSLCCSTNGKHCVPFRIHVIDFYSRVCTFFYFHS